LNLTLDLTSKSEYFQMLLWNRIIIAVSSQRVFNPKNFIQRFNEKIFPKSVL